jgi:hypothetical protein
MFDLERFVAEWRRQMAERGLRDSDIIDELESHVREEFEAQVRAGLAAEDAFTKAAQRVGHADVLTKEFANSFTMFDKLKSVVLTLAGIPNHKLATTMNTSHVEPAWATYLRATAFLLPGMFLAILAAIFVVPKLQQICRDAGLPYATAGGFWNLTYSSIQVILAIAHHGMAIISGILCAVVLLEWRLTSWPRYRRAAIGIAAFILNTLVLLAFFMMFLAAIVAAPGLAHAGK